jgi:hypothetical protein
MYYESNGHLGDVYCAKIIGTNDIWRTCGQDIGDVKTPDKAWAASEKLSHSENFTDGPRAAWSDIIGAYRTPSAVAANEGLPVPLWTRSNMS